MSEHSVSPGQVRAAVAEVLGDEPDEVDQDENLFEAGLDSIGLMRLLGQWRAAGCTVDFAELSQVPTLRAWIAVLTEGTATAVAPAATPTTPAEEPASCPLGVMQHAYWAGRTPGQRLGGVAAHLYTEFDRAPGGDGPVDPESLRRALDRLVERHETLRSRITPDGRQVVLPAGAALLVVHDLRDSGPAEIEAHLMRVRDEFSHQMLDIERGEVLALALTLLPGGASRLHVDVDMVAADAVSYRILLADLTALVLHPQRPLSEPGIRYRDHLTTVDPRRTEDAHRAAAAWQRRLLTLPGAPVLPEALRAPSTLPRVARRHVHLGPDRVAALVAAGRRHGVTTAMTVATVFAEVIGAWSTAERFLLNVPMFDRPSTHPDIDRVVGDFSSSVMLEVDLRDRVPFVERARQVQRRMHADAAHGAYSGLEVLRDLSRRRGEQVLAPVVFTSALNLGELFAPEVTAHFGEPVWIISQGPQVLLDAQLTELGGGMMVNWDCREDAFVPGVLDAMFTAFLGLLDRIIDDPDAWSTPVEVIEPLSRTYEGLSVRVVDHLDRDRPDHVPGILRAASGERAETWARADGTGGVELLGDNSLRIRRDGVPVGAVEVEEAVRTDVRVRDVVAVPQDGTLVAAVVTDAEADAATIRAGLLRTVPAHLVPSRIVVLPELPTSTSGEPDRAAVAALVAERTTEPESVEPRTDLERVVAGVWAEVLGLDRIGVTDEFVASGGDSLLAGRVVARLQEELNTDGVTLRALFQSPTVAGFAERIRQAHDPDEIDEVAALVLEIRSMSDEEIEAQLDSGVNADR
ncbi:phosphopantetheine-binding protein [Pseudonocardia spinosispora]|uniref:phosphopantetheine-binding protein n=1 Tax=Pseudonocardia spinosispora TaxID=103441 RepID=UPI00048BED06|nr:phosphopantetheine-binding protein [Pseudonocardia spinosispora]